MDRHLIINSRFMTCVDVCTKLRGLRSSPNLNIFYVLFFMLCTIFYATIKNILFEDGIANTFYGFIPA